MVDWSGSRILQMKLPVVFIKKKKIKDYFVKLLQEWGELRRMVKGVNSNMIHL
jgi:hypothetical protein